MMQGPSIFQYRILVILTIACLALYVLLIADLGLITFSEDVENARKWNNFEAVMPWSMILAWTIISGILWIVALTGLLFFKPFARLLLGVVCLANFLSYPFQGLLVVAPLEGFIGSLAGAFTVAVFVLSYWSPLSELFLYPNRKDGSVRLF